MSIDLFLSDKCNLQCKYCFNYDTNKKCSDWSRTLKTLEWYFKQEGATPGLTIYGGEPLLEWATLLKAVEWAEANPLNGKQHSISVVSNITLLNEERIQYLLDHNISVGNSFDGCPEAQDINRVFPDGSGTSEIVLKNIKLLKKISNGKLGHGCRCTFAPNTVHLLFESTRYCYEELNYDSATFVNASGAYWDEEHLKILEEQLKKLTDWVIERTIKLKKPTPLFHIRNAQRTLQGISTGKRWGVCSVGISRVGIDTSENIWICHRFCNPESLKKSQEWKLGTLDTGITNTKFLNAFKNFNYERCVIDYNPRCKDCILRDGCWFTCWGEVQFETDYEIKDDGVYFKYKPDWCEVRKLEYREGRRAIIELKKLGLEAYPQQSRPNIRTRVNGRIMQRPASNPNNPRCRMDYTHLYPKKEII